MRIISWNCNMAFRKKHEAILRIKPDIVVVSECENEERLEFGKSTPTPNDFVWHGDNPAKGIGVFSYSQFKFKRFDTYDPRFRYVIPLSVSGPINFNLFAVWAMDNQVQRRARYVAQVWLALQQYKRRLKKHSVLIGDFNSNTIWDDEPPQKFGNHTQVHDFLAARNIHSLYHLKTQQTLGKERTPTLYFQRNEKKPYHIDYCFASQGLFANGFRYSTGRYRDWILMSDHVPITADLNV